MTDTTKPVRRETLSSVRAARAVRPLLVELHSTFMRIRPKGTRRYYVVTYDQVFMLGARNEAEAARRERIERKKKVKELK